MPWIRRASALARAWATNRVPGLAERPGHPSTARAEGRGPAPAGERPAGFAFACAGGTGGRPGAFGGATLRAALALALAGLLGLGAGLSGPGALAQQGAPAQERAPEAQIAPLADALGMDRLLPVMRQEGEVYARDLADDLFPGRTTARWRAEVDAIYDVARMRDTMVAGLRAGLPANTVAPLTDFFTSDLGTRIVGLETSAREALLDPSVETASEEALEAMRAADDPRLALIEDFVEANDLVEMNVVGALNSNFAFYRGLEAGGAFDGTLTEEQMLADVWAQEPEIRADTETWVYSYLALAYGPLADDELERYVALSRSPEGQALNAALFAAFDRLFVRISRELGEAAAQVMSAEDI